MEKSFAVIGLGRFGLSLLGEIARFTDDILAIDHDEQAVEKASLIVNQCFIMDASNEASLREIGVENVDHAIISFGSDLEATILTLVSLKNIGIKKITVRCDNDTHVPILQKLGATDIISPQKLAGIRLANRIVSDNFSDYFNLTGDYSIVEVLAPETMKETTILSLDSRNRFGVNIILIQRNHSSFAPKATDSVMAGDQVFVFGKNAQILKFSDSLMD